MFTGIIEELGQVRAIENGPDSARIQISGPLVTSDAAAGSSIAVNGVCLTVVDLTLEADAAPHGRSGAVRMFTADVMAETLKHTALGQLRVGDPVNLERPMAADGRFGGHIVQGHVDGVGTVRERIPGERWEVVRIGCEPALARYVVRKGSVTVDGVSLTVVDVDPDAAWFTVSLIPETLRRTTLGHRGVGETVNLEVDVLAKYVERLLEVTR